MGLTLTKGTLGKTILGLGLVVGMALPFNHATPSVHAAVAQAALPPLVISDQQTGTWIRNFNPFSPAAVLDPTKAGIYEPLWIVPVGNTTKAYPWLATSYAWSTDLKTRNLHYSPGREVVRRPALHGRRRVLHADHGQDLRRL